ncbi:MAG: phytanoyl-CoA dioxygenase family protein [Candidatus Poribacteria bacterium]|nr:phytanoyl-CoA dioxygenase family protein [Candidatus Poribacteria bacterium]
MNQNPIKNGTPFSEECTREIVHDFKRDGFVQIPGVLEIDEVEALRAKVDALFDEPRLAESGHKGRNTFIIWHLNELDRIFCDMLIREPIYSLMEAIFGPGFQQCGNQVLRNGRGQAIDRWHVDNALWFPLPESVPRHDPRIEMPIFWLTVQIALTDIETIDHGPSQYVPGSHYSGRHPPETGTPVFESRGPVSIFCKAGDIYLHNSQCWHRGTPNRSDRLRYLLQQQYGASWAFPRYNAYIQYKMPAHLLSGASERLLKVLGDLRFHPETRYQ